VTQIKSNKTGSPTQINITISEHGRYSRIITITVQQSLQLSCAITQLNVRNMWGYPNHFGFEGDQEMG